MTKVIAEVANVHEGETSYMKKLVSLLPETGVDAIKFQYVIPSELVIQVLKIILNWIV